MDRTIVYPGAIPQDTDILSLQVDAMVDVAALRLALYGTSVVAGGLACATYGAGLQVSISPGSLTSFQQIDSSPFGSLSANGSSIVKQGINTGYAVTTTLTVPVTPGQSINWLIQANFQETDQVPVALPYYNASNPSVAYSGPANSGTAQNTVRRQAVAIGAKPGSAATTGSQLTPAPDSGWVALYIVTVNAGQVAIQPGDITVYPGAPFLPTLVTQMRRRLFAPLSLYVSTLGNDANAGLSPRTAFASKQAAWNYIVQNLDLNGYMVTVNVASGTYTDALVCNGSIVGAVGSAVAFTGTSVVINSSATCITASNGAVPTFFGFTLNSSTGYGIVALSGSTILYGGMNFGTCAVAHVAATSGTILETSPNTISGSATAHYSVSNNGTISTASCVITAGVSFSIAFAVAQLCGVLMFPTSQTFTGSGASTVNGTRYLAASNGVIQANGTGPNFIPGTTAGSTSTGGQYL